MVAQDEPPISQEHVFAIGARFCPPVWQIIGRRISAGRGPIWTVTFVVIFFLGILSSAELGDFTHEGPIFWDPLFQVEDLG